jgi:conjugative transfer pilus assembly protein TraH
MVIVKRKNRILLGCLCLLRAELGVANIEQDLSYFFDALGHTYTSKQPEASFSDTAGFLGGGALHITAPEREESVIQVKMPDYKSGCSGIDLFTGSLSYIGGDKLIDLGKQVMTNGGAYAADVMLATTVPELKQVRDYLQTMVQKVNQTSINSCEMAQNLVGGLWPKTAASQQKVCTDQYRLGREGLGHDYVAAHMACSGAGFQETMQQARGDDARKKQVILNKNLVWELMHDTSFLNKNQELAEFVMSLTGSIIIDAQGNIKVVPSLLKPSGALVHTILEGGDTRLWRCDEPRACLNTHLGNFKISEAYALSGHVRQRMQSINNKLIHDVELNVDEKAFLGMTSLPILKFLTALNRTHAGHVTATFETYVMLIAGDMLQHYLDGLIRALAKGSAGSVFHEDLVKALERRMTDAREQIARIMPDMTRKLSEAIALTEQMVDLRT